MAKKQTKTYLYRIAALTAVFFLLSSYLAPLNVFAAQITSRKVTLSNSAGGGTSVTYTFQSAALPTTGTPVQGVTGEVCTTASGSCTTPAGWTGASATLSAQPSGLGCGSSWNDDSTATHLRINHATCAVNPSGAVTVTWDGVTNPSAQNTTFYIRFTTFLDDDYGVGDELDTGTVAVSTAQQITVTASVDESITFCTGTSGVTTSSCAGATGTTVALGTLSASSTASSISQIGVGTNANLGYVVTINGTTLTCSACGGSTITAMTGATNTSTIGIEEFGVNLMDNATPNVGVAADGAGTATPADPYDDVDEFFFQTGDTIASKGNSDDFRRFHVAYITNISTATEAGAYQTVLTYIATATF